MIKFIFLFFSLIPISSWSKECKYSYTVWNVRERTSKKIVKVQKDYSELKEFEVTEFGCTPCEVDQVRVKLINGIEFKICNKVASKIQDILNKAIKDGFELEEVVGYRAQMSKGKVNQNGERTELSHHSFGLAFDINPKSNGLYTNCYQWDPEICRLIKGGIYNTQNPKAILKNTKLVKSLNEIGFKWGGEIKGRQKDFMHFSLSGY